MTPSSTVRCPAILARPTSVHPRHPLVYRRPAGVDEHLARAAELREESQRAQAAAAAELRQAARELKDTGMPLRDIGHLLNVSYQRAHQLVS